jgi:hypothetical protein
MATTTNFGWETPDDTDLVKDGALAMRTLGNAIDTSLVDLKGGTTGQVLSKTSNTDMDFTWVTSDDANAIQNAIVDAKGDLITATAADTPARLGVGTNGQVLTADSTTATGLKWATTSSGSMTHIATTTLSSTATNIEFTSIASTYQTLYLVWQLRGDWAGNNVVQLTAQLNGDTASNYFTYGSGRYASAGSAVNLIADTGTYVNLGYIPAAIPDAKYMGVGQMTIPNYKNTTLKKALFYTNISYSDAPSFYSSYGGWNNTNAVSSIKLTVQGGNLIVGSSVSLYGLSA